VNRWEAKVNKLKALSFSAVAVVVLIAGYSLSQQYAQYAQYALERPAEMTQAIETLNEVQAIVREQVSDPTSRAQIDRRVDILEGTIKKLEEPSKPGGPAPDHTGLYIKLLFSLLFGGAALYVVLSQKYDDETKKWAFSVLSLLAGVWIGTAT
jgi:hypothetical protein